MVGIELVTRPKTKPQVIPGALRDAYGKRTVLMADGVTVRTASLHGNQYGFTGRYLDKETELWYFRARAYSSQLGRFISRDNGFIDGFSLYSAYFIPNLLDPSGNVSWSKLFKGVAKITFGLASVAGGVVATGGTGGAAAPVGIFFIVGGMLSIASGLSDFTQAFTGGDVDVPASIPTLAARVIVDTGGLGGTITGDSIEAAGEIADLFTPNGMERVVAEKLLNVADTVDHVQTISEKLQVVKESLDQHGVFNPTPTPGNTGGGGNPGNNSGNRTLEAKINLRGPADLRCKQKFREHLVRAGDTLWDLWIARADKSIPWKDMITANKFLESVDYIHPGDYVCAPCRKGR